MNLDQRLAAFSAARVLFPSGLIIHASLATNDLARTTGYAGRVIGPPYGTGILFVFPSIGIVPFTMAETSFPLDLVFLRSFEVSGAMVRARIIARALGQARAADPIYCPLPFDLSLETTARSALGIERDNTATIELRR